MARRAGGYGRLATLFAVAFLVLVAVLALLDYFGLPQAVLGTILGGAALVAFTAIGINASTMQTSEFYLAARSVPAPANGMASAAAVMAGAIFLGLAGGYFTDTGSAAAVTIGWSLGFLILAVCIAPYFRKSAAFGVGDFLGVRYGGGAVRIAAGAVVVAALVAALAAAIATASLVAAGLLDVSAGVALAVVAAVILTSTVLGGVRAITRTAIAEYIVLAFAILVPVAIVSMREFSWAVPQITFGLALKDAALLVLASGKDLAVSPPGRFWPMGAPGPFAFFATIVTLATGVAAMPHLLLRSATVRTPNHARRSVGWSLLFVLVVALTAPAYAAFARLVILREVVDSGIGNLPDWIFTFGKLGLIKICGADAISADVAFAACSTGAAFSGNLPAGELAISGDAIVLAGPAIFDLPAVGTALIAVGALAATLAAAKAMAFAIASAIGHDLYGGALDTRASAGRQLIVTRLLVIAAVVLAAWLAAASADDVFALAPMAISLSASGLFPALILAVWWKRANAPGAVAGIIAGSVVTAALIADHRYPGFLPFGRLGFDELTAGIVGMPIGFLAAVATSLVTEPPSEERQVIVDAIRRPGGTPFVQESESQ